MEAPADADGVTREAYSEELISFGFWAGDARTREPAYYSYTSPAPAGLTEQPLAVGGWEVGPTGSMARLPYETVRSANDPAATLRAFLDSTYGAGSTAAGWDRASLDARTDA